MNPPKVSRDSEKQIDNRVSALVEKLKTYRPSKVILFDSYARGEADKYSDLDFVVIKKTSKRFLERLVEVDRIMGAEGSNLDIFVYTPEKWERMVEWGNSFAERVLAEGKTIYENE